MECDSGKLIGEYAPPPVGNGELSAMIDMEGAQAQRSYAFGVTPSIWWAGRRYDTPRRELIPFGRFEQDVGAIANWRQSLDPRRGLVTSECLYEDGGRIATEVFVHLNHPMIVVRKSFNGYFEFRYVLARPGSVLPPRRVNFKAGATANGVDVFYEADGQQTYRGVISVLCDRPAETLIDGNIFRLKAKSEPATFFIIMTDSLDHTDIHVANAELKRLAAAEGFDGLLSSNSQAWNAYWSEGRVELADAKENEAYVTAQYHLRISSTRWSVPTGVFASHWQGIYFPFDDHFSYMALAGSGHLTTAAKIPAFRRGLLDKAIFRAYSYHGSQGVGTGARFSWASWEDGAEAAAPGFYLDHIFNMASIARTAWEHYRFSGDPDYLRDSAYPVIANCADFNQSQSLYKTSDGRLIVGKCTDLERLGAARENAFMTTCGVISTFEAAARAAERLGVDGNRSAAWRALAAELRSGLPRENGRYAPYPGCAQSSIALFAGIFPYPALPVDDPLQLAAINDFLSKESTCGNMYPVGDSVCVWYSGWKGVCFARMGLTDMAEACVAQAVAETNNFAEIFEIRTPAHHPWFTTAEGAFAHMVNETRLQSREGEIRIMPSKQRTRFFRLAAVGGVTVEARFEDGLPRHAKVEASRPYKGVVRLDDSRVMEVDLREGETRELL